MYFNLANVHARWTFAPETAKYIPLHLQFMKMNSWNSANHGTYCPADDTLVIAVASRELRFRFGIAPGDHREDIKK